MIKIGEVTLRECLAMTETLKKKIGTELMNYAEINISWANVEAEKLVFQVKFDEFAILVEFAWRNNRWQIDCKNIEKLEMFVKIIKRIRENEKNIDFLKEVMYKI